MRILLSGGIKTQNILSSIEKKFQSSGDDFIVVEYLDDIEEIFGRGDYFDKAVITEQSITREYEIKDEAEIRSRINQFAINSAAKPKKYNYVFLATTDEMANMIHEEILPIMNESVVVVKQPPYYVNFFVTIIVNDVKQLPEDIVYVPKMLETDVDNDNTFSDNFTDMDVDSDSVNIKLASQNFDEELFGSISEVETSKEVSEDLKIDNEEELELPEDLFDTLDEEDVTEEVEEEKTEETKEDTINIYKPVNMGKGTNNMLGHNDDESIDIIGINPIEQSENLPDYTRDRTDKNTEYIPGFDDEDDTESESSIETEYESTGFNDYDAHVENNIDTDDYNNEHMIQNSGYDMGFENPEINEQADEFNNGFIADSIPGFDTSDYDSDDENIDTSMNTSYTETEQAGFNSSDYEQSNNTNNIMVDDTDTNTTPNVTLEKGGKTKKGLLSKLKSNIGNQVAQVAAPVVQEQPVEIATNKKGISASSVKLSLKPFAARGNSIVVTGCGGCGTSFISYNLANIISQLGYTVLLVDMDTEGRTQSYISKTNYESMESDGANLMSAVNSSTGINTHISIVKQGFHLLTMGLGTDTAPASELLHQEKLARFVNLAKTSHNFVIYDIPFNTAIGFLSDVTYMCDNLVLVTDASNWGITKTMLSVCNIASGDMQDTMFSRAQLVFNKYRNLHRVLGNKVKTCTDITKVMDKKVLELVGDDPGFHFEDLHIAGIINDDPEIENSWFEEVQYSDTKKGQDIFLELIENIVLKK